jgi:hypothetical protein
MFERLLKFNVRPVSSSVNTDKASWTEPPVSERGRRNHFDESAGMPSRNAAYNESAVIWYAAVRGWR